MKEHLRRTIAILRAYPVLWAPYVVATVLAYCLDLLRHVAERRIVYWEFSRQVPSVLGGNFSRRPFDASAMETVHRLRSVLVWAVHYVNISIFAVAMVLTAMLAYASLCNEQPAFAFAAARLTSYPKRILVYAAKAWFLMLVLNAILYWPIYLPAFHLSWGSLGFVVLSRGLSLLDQLCFAWILAPVALRLLRPAAAPASSIEEKKLARNIFMLTVVAYEAISTILDSLVIKLHLAQQPAVDAAFQIAGLIANAPYVPLYVALALIAYPEMAKNAPQRNSRLRGLMGSLMPLHFRPPEGS